MKTPGRRSRAKKLLRVGLYDLENPLGEGNFAIVKLGVHKLTKAKVAVKIVDKNELDKENLAKIYREIAIMRNLSHPNIIQLYQVMESDNFMYIVTEFAAGGEIYDHLVEHGRQTEVEAAKTFSQILSAVAYCHRHNVVHRDLKAENLLLDHKGNIKLADFGFSNYFSQDPQELLSTWCGSPPYAAPELFEGRKYDGPKTDIWSLGVILYVLVSGNLPFDGDTLQELRSRVVCCQYRIPFFLSEDCEHLVRNLLVLEPIRRLSIKQISEHRWLVGRMEAAHVQSLREEVVGYQDRGVLATNTDLLDLVLELAGPGVTKEMVQESVVDNKCDDLSAMHWMLVQNQSPVSRERQLDEGTQVQSCLDQVTEVYTEQETQQRLDTLHCQPRSGRRHTLGPALQGSPLLTLPTAFPLPYKDILLHTNLALNLPLVSNQPFTDFSSKDKELLRAPPGLPMGRRASDCGVYSFPGEMGQHSASGADKRQTGAEEASSHSPDSPRKRRTGLMTVVEKRPEIPVDLVSEVETRMHQTTFTPFPPFSIPDTTLTFPPLSPTFTPSRTFRQPGSRVSSLKEPHSLNLFTERYSPVRRLSEGSSLSRSGSISQQPHPLTPSSCEESPCEIRALQEEYKQLNQETRLSIDSASSGYHSPQYLLPPTPPVLLTPQSPISHLPVLRRSSESNVIKRDSGLTVGQGHPTFVRSVSTVHQDSSDLMAAMYQDMYPPNKDAFGRRSSYPNSPSHGFNNPREKHSLTQHLQKLCLQQRITEAANESSGLGVRFKGSITQGVPSLAATTPTSTPSHHPKPALALIQAFPARNPPERLDLQLDNPEICITDVLGDEIKLVIPEPMDETH